MIKAWFHAGLQHLDFRRLVNKPLLRWSNTGGEAQN